MSMAEVIRNNRLKRKLPQHKMANYLGVTSSAVSKWERGKALPDISLLAPIARLLQISLEELLCFTEELTDQQINEYMEEANRRLKLEPYDTVFFWARNLVKMYPNSMRLILWMATVLESHGLMAGGTMEEKNEKTIVDWYERVLLGEEESDRQGAAERLFYFYLRKQEYEKAESTLEHFSWDNPEKKRKRALLYARTHQVEEAFRTYEELLFAEYQSTSGVLQDMLVLAIKENDLEKARFLVGKQVGLAGVFDMGPYYQASPRLELAVLEKDIQTTVETVRAMLEKVEEMDHFAKSPLYAHMSFQELRKEFLKEVKRNLEEYIRDEETFGYMKDHEEWKALLKRG